MQSISANLKAALIDIDARATPRILVDVYEFYAPDYAPDPVNGFEPADAEEQFAAETLTWNGVAYRRELISRGDIVRNMGEKTNSVSLTFSNISRYMATLAQSQTIEGMFLVIRCVVPSVTDDSLVLFVGRCEKPSDIDKKQFSLSAKQDFGNINQEIPPRLFNAEDPNGRVPSDPLYEGFRIMPLSGSFQFPVTVPSTSFFGRLLGRTKTEMKTQQYSSLDSTPYGGVVPMIFGRCQMAGIPIFFADIGFNLIGVWAFGEGRVDTFTNLIVRDRRFLQQTQEDHYGDPGGTGTNATSSSGPINQGYLSKTAYTILSMYGSEGETVDEAPEVSALVKGMRVPTPDSSGVFNVTQWSDNPVDIARFILTDSRLVRIPETFMEDSVNYQTHLHCNEALIDESNGEVTLLPAGDVGQGGTTIRRFTSTGLLTARYFLYYYFGITTIVPELVDAEYTSFDLDDIPTVFDPIRVLRKRYTVNCPITERVRALDFLYKTIFTAAKLFIRINKRGKVEIRSEKPADATHLRTSTAVAATSIPINDVLPWKSGDLLTGRALLGFGLTTSEVRDVTSADYSTAGNSVTLAASVTGGGVTAVASGANLAGGSTTVQASGTVTIGGTPAAGNTATITIDGIASTYTLVAADTTGTVAAMLKTLINAHPRLQKYIEAIWSSGTPTVVTIKSKQGALNVAALLKAHTGPIADPASFGSTLTGAVGGVLAAGTYKVAYSDVTAVGRTALSPLGSITLSGVSTQFSLSTNPAFPAGVTSRNYYMSDAADSLYLKFITTRVSNANFSIATLPAAGAAIPPTYNTTGEELIRVAMSFATNSQDVYSVWPASAAVLLTEIYLPTTPNGHRYVVTTAGTTAATEPTWPLTAGATVASGTAVFTEDGSTVLQQAGLTRANIVKDSYRWPLGSRQASVNQIKGSYRDSNLDFALQPLRVNDRTHQTQVNKIYPLEVDMTAIDNYHQAFRIANWMLAKNREGDWFNTLGTGPQGLVLEEGDVICASDDSGGEINRVTRIEELRIKPNHDVVIGQARKYSTLMFSDDVGADTIPVPTTLRYTATADSIVEFIDNFPIRDADGLTPGFYVAVSRDLNVTGDWRGWALHADYGDGYLEISRGDIPAIIGECTTTLATVTDPSVWDLTSSVTFTLKYGPPAPFAEPFATVTKEQLASNSRRNLFLIGNEYIQAATIVSNGNQSYTASVLLRGCFGTDSWQLVHGATERMVFLDGSEKLVQIDPVRLNGEFDYKSVTTNQDVVDASAEQFTWTGGTVKPLSPVQITGTRNAANDVLVEWKRRSRLGPGLRPLSDVPFAEEREEYKLEFYLASVLKATYFVQGPLPITPFLLDRTPVDEFGVPNSLQVSFVTELGLDVHGSYVEGTVTLDPALAQSVGLVDGLMYPIDDGSGGITWTTPFIVTAGVDSTNGLYVSEQGLGTVYTQGVAYAEDTARIRVALIDGRIHYYLNPLGFQDVPLYISTLTNVVGRDWHGRFFFQDGDITDIKFKRSDKPFFTYTAAQQTADGLTPGNLHTVRIRQVSAMVGEGDYREATV